MMMSETPDGQTIIVGAPPGARIVALDLGGKTGWAHSDGSSGIKDFHFSSDERHGSQMKRFGDWLTRFSDTTHFVCESAHHRGGAATMRGVGMLTVLDMFAALCDSPLHAVHTGTLKKYATGSGRAEKAEMRLAARGRWPNIDIIDDNHCDALWLLDYAVQMELWQ